MARSNGRFHDAFDPDRRAALEMEARRLRADYLRALVYRAFRRAPRLPAQSTRTPTALHRA